MAYPGNPISPGSVQLTVGSFDRLNGSVSIWLTHPAFPGWGANGLEFSPNGSILYAMQMEWDAPAYFSLHQFNVSIPDGASVLASESVIDSEYLSNAGGVLGNLVMALAPDGRIYVNRGEEDHLGVIMEPDSFGPAVQYVREGLAVPTSPANGLPNQAKRYHDSQMSVGDPERSRSSADLEVWPVPTMGLLNMKVSRPGHVELIDATGRVVAAHGQAPGSSSMDLTDLPSGIFSLRFTPWSGAPLVRRVVKK